MGNYGDGTELKAKSIRANQTLKNKDVSATVTNVKLVGTFLMTEEGYRCFLHPSERLYEPTLGELVNVRVIGVRPEWCIKCIHETKSF